MKKILSLLVVGFTVVVFSSDLKATHLAGGEIFYRHIGGPTNPFLYEITAIIYRDMSGIDLPPTLNVCVSSSCYNSQTVNLTDAPLDSSYGGRGSTPPGRPPYGPCAVQTPGVDPTIGLYKWRGTVTLPGVCADWRFSFTQNARNPAIDNLVGPGGQNLYIEALLNNTFGPNSSPIFTSSAATAFCVSSPGQQPQQWVQRAIESDGDSIVYRLAQPQGGPNCGPGNLVAYTAGYSVSDPIRTINGFNLNPNNGTFTFNAAFPEVCVIKVVVDEYRFSTSILQWVLVGNTTRDLQCIITGLCNSNAVKGPALDTDVGTGITVDDFPSDSLYQNYDLPPLGNDFNVVNGDTIFDIPIIDYNCYDSSITIFFNDDDVLCSSVSPDGTDFRVIGPDSIVRPVVNVEYSCTPDGLTDEFTLKLLRPLDINGDYVMYVRRGHDGNTLLNSCSYEMPNNFAMIIRVNNCPILDYDLKNVTVINDNSIKVQWEADSNSFNPAFFNLWRIFRANNDNNFYPLTTIFDVNTREFIDTINIDAFQVDNQVYQYSLQVVINNIARVPTRDIRSILLAVDTFVVNNYISVFWNKYEGFSPDEENYLLELSSDTGNTWTLLKDHDSSETREYRYDIPVASPENEGVYIMRVLSNNVTNPNYPYSSESNWVYFEIFYDEPPQPPVPEDPVIPNVMTPNNDSQNDRFFIDTQEYSKISVAIYNRWGRQVFKDDNFAAKNTKETGWDGTDMATGQVLPDGVYYYTIILNDPDSGKNLDYQGSLTIMGGSN